VGAGSVAFAQSVELARLPCMVPVARRWVGGLLAGWPRVADAELLMTELCTGSLRFGCGPTFTLVLAPAGDVVRLGVVDHARSGETSAGAALGGDVTDDVMGDWGRSLRLVGALASRWGHDREPDGRCVMWGELAGGVGS
jgi:hypothetical protein